MCSPTGVLLRKESGRSLEAAASARLLQIKGAAVLSCLPTEGASLQIQDWRDCKPELIVVPSKCWNETADKEAACGDYCGWLAEATTHSVAATTTIRSCCLYEFGAAA
jgi:hypothetical protein